MTTYVTGMTMGLNAKTLPGLVFDVDASFTGCLICGEVYQSRLDRKCKRINDDLTHPQHHLLDSFMDMALNMRKQWDRSHSKTHTQQQHADLRQSGLFCTPEAALKLTPLGVIGLEHANTSSTQATEVADAMYEAPRAPLNDVQGT